MQREFLLLAIAAIVVIAAGAGVLLVPGALAEREEENIRPSDLRLGETTVSPVSVGGETVTLQLTTRLEHRGGPAENVTLLVRTTDTATGIVESTETTAVGTINTTGERAVTTNITLDREGSHGIETLVYEGDERILSSQTEISGLEALRPAYARTSMEFRESDLGPPPVTFAIDNVSDGRAQMAVSAALTNTGAETVDDLELVVLAQQADSNIVADRARTDIGSIRSGRTVSPSVQLSVPDEYNYRLYAILKRDGVDLQTAQARALLNPEETVPENTTTRDVELDTGEFSQDDQSDDEPGRTPSAPTDTPAGGAGPGFGVLTALLAVIVIALGYSRRDDT